MRSVCFVERLELDLRGNLFNQALEVGDVDNDEGNELIVGNISGELVIFKGTDPKPWRSCSDLGMITCVGIGDIFNNKKNYLVCLNAEGWCYIFDVKPDSEKLETSGGLKDLSHSDRNLSVTFKTHLPPNSKVLLIADADGDGNVELVIGYSDRVVRMFRCHEPGDESTKCKFEMVEKWQLLGQIGSITINQNVHGSPTLMAAQPGCTFCTLIMRQDTLATKVAMETDTKSSSDLSGEDSDSRDTISIDSNYVDPSEPSLIYHPLASSRTRNLNVTTVIIGGVSRTPYTEQADKLAGKAQKNEQEIKQQTEEQRIKKQAKKLGSNEQKDKRGSGTQNDEKGSDTQNDEQNGEQGIKEQTVEQGSKASFYALCTLDGNLMLVDDDNIVWSLQVHHQLFAISKLDVTGDGTHEVIVCSCDGQTYIVNYNRQVVRFQFEENVSAFTAGLFAVSGDKNVPCLIYATFSNKIYIYYNISIPVPTSNLMKAMETSPKTSKLLASLNVNVEDPNQLKQLYHWCLYGQPGDKR